MPRMNCGGIWMYELIQAGERTFYIESPSKIGIYRVNDRDVWLIDSGNDKEAAKKILKILDANGFKLLGIVNTHSNADHIGGNRYLQEKTGCKIISTDIENAFSKYPILETSFLYGGYPVKELRNKFLLAPSCEPTGTVDRDLPGGLEYIALNGHYFGMIGIKTPDNVYFLADSVFKKDTLSKYHIVFIYDVRAFLHTLDALEQLEGNFYIPSHAEAVADIKPLVDENRRKIYEIMDKLLEICAEPLNFEEILKGLFDRYQLTLDFNQYVLVGSTVRSYLAYLHDEGRLNVHFRENRLLWERI